MSSKYICSLGIRSPLELVLDTFAETRHSLWFARPDAFHTDVDGSENNHPNLPHHGVHARELKEADDAHAKKTTPTPGRNTAIDHVLLTKRTVLR